MPYFADHRLQGSSIRIIRILFLNTYIFNRFYFSVRVYWNLDLDSVWTETLQYTVTVQSLFVLTHSSLI